MQKLNQRNSKCYNIHIGEKSETCCNLKVHSSMMNKKDHKVYLGEVICSSGKNYKIIANKVNRGVGVLAKFSPHLMKSAWATIIMKLHSL